MDAQLAGAVHDTCNQQKDLATSNKEAIARGWRHDSEASKDAFHEVGDLLSTGKKVVTSTTTAVIWMMV